MSNIYYFVEWFIIYTHRLINYKWHWQVVDNSKVGQRHWKNSEIIQVVTDFLFSLFLFSYLILEFCNDGSLESRRYQNLPIHIAYDFMRQIIEGMKEYIYKKNIDKLERKGFSLNGKEIDCTIKVAETSNFVEKEVFEDLESFEIEPLEDVLIGEE